MGAADIIPGVSGGTVALITGIYERLIDAIKSVNLLFVPYFFRGVVDRKYFTKAKENFLGIDFKLLLPLIAGIAAAFLLLANIIGPLRENYPTYMSAFFFGLIVSSSLLVFISIKIPLIFKTITQSLFFIFMGILAGYFVVGLVTIQTNHSMLVIFFSGMITICAMILPGISGAFILWFLGQYDFMLGILRKLTSLDFSGLSYTVAYIFGGVFGILIFSRILSYFIKHYKYNTFSFLLGLMLGALRKPGELVMNNPENIAITVVSAAAGVLIVSLFAYYKFYADKESASLS
jgi:putative membrane protein